jgi:hypothetical protein
MMVLMLKGIFIAVIAAGAFAQIDQQLYEGRHVAALMAIAGNIAHAFGI